MPARSTECIPPVSIPRHYPWQVREQFSRPASAVENSRELSVRPRRKPYNPEIPGRVIAPSLHDDKNGEPPGVYQYRDFPESACRCPEFPALPGAANVSAPAAPAHTNISRVRDRKAFASYSAQLVPPLLRHLRPPRCLA